jgi:adenosine deaminase
MDLSFSDLVTLPKAEVHVHLEGCFDLSEIIRLAARAATPLPRPPEHLLQFEGLASFLAFLDWSCGLLRTAEELSRAAYRFSRRMSESGVLYADVIVNPTHWVPWRNSLAAMLDAFDTGFAEAEQDGFAPVGLCVSLLRQQSASEAIELVEQLLSLRHPRVVALSVDGNEAGAGRTGPRFAEAFRRAGAGGLKRTVHAGESSGPEGVWDALNSLGADRIDHGVRAIEDPALMALLAEQRIPLGVCPTSNLTLGLYRTIESHPIDALRQAGVLVSVNTDDPALLGVALPDEYARCAAAFGWDHETLRALAGNSIEASFADDARKASLRGRLAEWPAGS